MKTKSFLVPLLLLSAVFLLPLTVQAQTATPTATPSVAPSPTPTPNPSVSPTPATTLAASDRKLNLTVRLKLQGILKKPDSMYKNIALKTDLSGGSLSTKMTKSLEAAPSTTGIWQGTVQFDEVFTSSTSESTFKISIKPPKHLRRNICINKPIEYKASTYKCPTSGSSVTLTKGDNTLDLTNIYFLAGDLPLTNNQQNGVINSEDLVYIRGKLGSKTPSVLDIADLNMDGIVDTQDFGLAIVSMGINNTDEQ